MRSRRWKGGSDGRGRTAYTITNPEKVKGHEMHKVTITGKLDKATSELTVDKLEMTSSVVTPKLPSTDLHRSTLMGLAFYEFEGLAGRDREAWMNQILERRKAS